MGKTTNFQMTIKESHCVLVYEFPLVVFFQLLQPLTLLKGIDHTELGVKDTLRGTTK